MATAPCDVLVVRETDDNALPEARPRATVGRPPVDLEAAIVNPATAFESPRDVVKLDDISVGLRRRILQVWEYDIRAAMVEENEGGPVRDIDAGTLRDIQAARAALDSMDVGQARDGS